MATPTTLVVVVLFLLVLLGPERVSVEVSIGDSSLFVLSRRTGLGRYNVHPSPKRKYSLLLPKVLQRTTPNPTRNSRHRRAQQPSVAKLVRRHPGSTRAANRA